jgi:uncharacterized SAM-binding protein YcdF (DUF218 family)
MKNLYFVIGILCVSYDIIVGFFGWSAINYIVLFIGAGLIVLSFFYCRFTKLLQKTLNFCFIAAALFIFFMSGFIYFNSLKNTVDFKEDCVIVLGAAIKGTTVLPILKIRLEKSLEYLKNNPSALIIVSGGQLSGEDISEAEAMKQYLISNGVSADRIFKEDRSKNTLQNIKFSKVISDDYFNSENYTAACITSDFHSYRAGVLADKTGLKITHYHSQTPCHLLPMAYFREILSICKMKLMFCFNMN